MMTIAERIVDETIRLATTRPVSGEDEV